MRRGIPDGLSPNLCVKGYFNDAGRQARAVSEAETGFYRDLAAPSGVRTLRSVYAEFDLASSHGVVVTEDIVAEGGVFLDGNSPYTPDQTADSLGELAKLHAAFWNDAQYAAASWLSSRMSSMLDPSLVPRWLEQIDKNFEGPLGVGVPREVRGADRLVNSYRKLAELEAAADPWCVIHGDAHVGNLFLDAARRPSLVDWQLVQRGSWSIDVGYHIASSLTVADRRRTDRDLLQHYLDQLASHGVRAPSWDDAWPSLRRGIVYGLFLWAITTYVHPSITTRLLERLGTAAADHEALAALSSGT